MHSRIYQIAPTPVKRECYLTPSDFIDHCFTSSVADYIDDEVDRDADLKSLCERLNGIAAFEAAESFRVLPGGKEIYFAKAFETFVAARDKTLGMGLSEFASGGYCESVHIMKRTYCETFDIYVTSDDLDMIPLDDFIRHAEIGRSYYIGATLDYHF